MDLDQYHHYYTRERWWEPQRSRSLDHTASSYLCLVLEQERFRCQSCSSKSAQLPPGWFRARATPILRLYLRAATSPFVQGTVLLVSRS